MVYSVVLHIEQLVLKFVFAILLAKKCFVGRILLQSFQMKVFILGGGDWEFPNETPPIPVQ